MSKNYSYNSKILTSENIIIILGSLSIALIGSLALCILQKSMNLIIDKKPIILTLSFFTIQFIFLKLLFNILIQNLKQNHNETEITNKKIKFHLINSIVRFISTILFFFIMIKIYKLNPVLFTSILISLYLIFSIFDVCLTLTKLHSDEV
ncbi:MAG: hypothetical protein GY830_00310 [Bacteroidetes bacterium]|nr:hypothetical protein [Bacteroidota bacterium]